MDKTRAMERKMAAWNPVEKPFRVSAYFKSGMWGHHGWNSQSKSFATYDEAHAHAMQIKNATSISVDRALNPENWMECGRWSKPILTFKRKKRNHTA